jgi:glycosyl-4,4'-diaponeurosporenoate acyltransferase
MATPAWLPPVGASAAFWLLASLLIGGLANRLPDRVLRSPPLAVRRDGAGIRLWKRWIPDAGGALPGGVRKASLVRRDPQALRRLVLETRRAELVHAVLWPLGLLTALWLPPAGVLVNLAFATVMNLPCLLLQRHNRSRLQRCLARMAAPGRASGTATDSAPGCGTRIESGRCTGL